MWQPDNNIFEQQQKYGKAGQELSKRENSRGQRDVVISANNNEEVFILPVVPEISVTAPQENEPFKTADKGYMNMIGDLGLRQFTIASIFPVRHYPFMRPGSSAEPFDYINFINKWRIEKVPFRVVASRHNGRVWFNIPMLVDNFEYQVLKSGNIQYTLQLTEYVFHSELLKR